MELVTVLIYWVCSAPSPTRSGRHLLRKARRHAASRNRSLAPRRPGTARHVSSTSSRMPITRLHLYALCCLLIWASLSRQRFVAERVGEVKQQHDEERTYCLKLPASLPLGLDDRHWYRITITCHTSVGAHELIYRSPILGVIHRWLEVLTRTHPHNECLVLYGFIENGLPVLYGSCCNGRLYRTDVRVRVQLNGHL